MAVLRDKRLKLIRHHPDQENAVHSSDQNWVLLHLFELGRLLSDLQCPFCGETGLTVSVSEGEQQGYASKLLLKCDGCDYIKHGFSSPRLGYTDNKTHPFEINRRMALLSHEVGASHAILNKFSTVMGIPAMHLKTYQTHDKKVTGLYIFLEVIINK